VSISPVDETTFTLFAPHPAALAEAKERITELLAEEVVIYIY
jgi:hypothetical protein